jgi:hypothetical protein
MATQCPKCGYIRGDVEDTPSTECPSCRVIYEKFKLRCQRCAYVALSSEINEPGVCPNCGVDVESFRRQHNKSIIVTALRGNNKPSKSKDPSLLLKKDSENSTSNMDKQVTLVRSPLLDKDNASKPAGNSDNLESGQRTKRFNNWTLIIAAGILAISNYSPLSLKLYLAYGDPTPCGALLNAATRGVYNGIDKIYDKWEKTGAILGAALGRAAAEQKVKSMNFLECGARISGMEK